MEIQVETLKGTVPRDNARLVADFGSLLAGFAWMVVLVSNRVDVLTEVMARISCVCYLINRRTRQRPSVTSRFEKSTCALSSAYQTR